MFWNKSTSKTPSIKLRLWYPPQPMAFRSWPGAWYSAISQENHPPSILRLECFIGWGDKKHQKLRKTTSKIIHPAAGLSFVVFFSMFFWHIKLWLGCHPWWFLCKRHGESRPHSTCSDERRIGKQNYNHPPKTNHTRRNANHTLLPCKATHKSRGRSLVFSARSCHLASGRRTWQSNPLGLCRQTQYPSCPTKGCGLLSEWLQHVAMKSFSTVFR